MKSHSAEGSGNDVALLSQHGAMLTRKTLVNRVTGRQPSYATSAEMEDWKKHATAVVTGANKGIGFAIAKKLGKEGVTTILTARNPELGAAAQKQLKEEGVDVEFHQLDISDKDSVKSFAKWLEKEHGGLDILVNNAGFAFKGNTFGANEARQTNAINYFGTRNVTQELLPLLKKSSAGARVVTVGSRAGTLSILSPELQRKFSDPELTLEQLDQLMNEFPNQIEAGTYKQNGWPASMYGVSKVGVAAFNRILARDLAKRGDDGKVLVNVCCPGYVNTDMSSHRGYKTIDEGADTPVWLALQPPDGPSGRFFTDRRDVGY
ncbi:NAD(P)-binding Rossmann-fold superfamily protein [Klebsormidium nitens]|uniref:NAD(P)-binding Rossmann-fold superfamily protein n=1 Tax=Klebsormidium nitens TaxID=105231 RepID=A0A1Y1I5N8_KLENI|nr:NAD(P)-binding Rossmann-fold superfamily protein [Klebsormidium nitens]|eukprot:GAQ84026.1 NAD(P)-binding Rossmann-fold superfamily protein [Klebsormidium nitens]